MQFEHGACLSHFSFLRRHSRQELITLFRRRILGGPAGLLVFGGEVLSRNTLRLGVSDRAAGDAFSGDVDWAGPEDWFVHESGITRHG